MKYQNLEYSLNPLILKRWSAIVKNNFELSKQLLFILPKNSPQWILLEMLQNTYPWTPSFNSTLQSMYKELQAGLLHPKIENVFNFFSPKIPKLEEILNHAGALTLLDLHTLEKQKQKESLSNFIKVYNEYQNRE